MGKIDKTEENLKLKRLDRNDREALFNKFVDAGGQVTDEKGEIAVKKNKAVYDRKKQQAYKNRIEEKKKKLKKQGISSAKNPKNQAKSAAANRSSSQGPNPFHLFLQRQSIKFRLVVMKITDFSTASFNNKFLKLFNNEYMASLMSLQSLFNELFPKNQDIRYDVINDLDNVNSIYYDLLRRTAKLNDVKELLKIIQPYLDYPESAHSVSDAREPLLLIFKYLYILKSYQENIFIAYETALISYNKHSNDKSFKYSLKRKNLKSDIYIVFNKLFYALYLIFCKFQQRIIPIGSPEIERILGISMEDKPGTKRKKVDTSSSVQNEETPEDEEAEEEQEVEEQEEKEELSDEIKKGLKLLTHFEAKNIKKLRSMYDTSKTFIKVKDNDKMLYIYLIFNEFDKEYAFLLTTNKVKFAANSSREHGTNFKDRMLLLYNEMRKCNSVLSDYANASEIFQNSKSEKPVNDSQYIEYRKKIGALANKCEQAANTARLTIASLMDNISRVFRIFANDMRKDKKIIENPDDVLKFDVSAEGKKRLRNKTIFEAVFYMHYFTSALVHRLSSNGDLSGPLEFDEEPDETETIDAIEEHVEPDKAVSLENNNIPGIDDSEEEERPLTEELDDLL